MPDTWCVAFSDVAGPTRQIIPVKNTFIDFGDVTGSPTRLRGKTCPPRFNAGAASIDEIEWELCHAMALSTRFDFHAKASHSSDSAEPGVSLKTSDEQMTESSTEEPIARNTATTGASPDASDDDGNSASCAEEQMEQAWPDAWDPYAMVHMPWDPYGDPYASAWDYAAHMDAFCPDMGWPLWDPSNTFPAPATDALSEASTDVTDPEIAESTLTGVPSMKVNACTNVSDNPEAQPCHPQCGVKSRSTRGRDTHRATSDSFAHVIVRNTFIDIDDASDSPTCMRAESCPPSRRPGAADLDENE
jgi:hypothetical protein